jgi:hypothetical protein
MKISEARQAYTVQLQAQRSTKKALLEEQQKQKQQMENKTGVTLELSEEYQKRYQELQERIDALSEQIEQNQKGLDNIIEMETGIFNAEASKQQGDAMKEAAENMTKCMEIARRISKGDKVPASDEQKLMEFNMEIYQMAKNMAVMNANKKHKEWDSLWDDEEDDKENPDPQEVADNTEMRIDAPVGDAAVAAENDAE